MMMMLKNTKFEQKTDSGFEQIFVKIKKNDNCKLHANLQKPGPFFMRRSKRDDEKEAKKVHFLLFAAKTNVLHPLQ